MALSFTSVTSAAGGATYGDVRGNWRMGDDSSVSNLLCGHTATPYADAEALMLAIAPYSDSVPTSITAVLARAAGVTIPDDAPGAGAAMFALYDVAPSGGSKTTRLAIKVPHFKGDTSALDAIFAALDTTGTAKIKPFTNTDTSSYAGLKGGSNIR